jgi:hydroxymethylpyrimidine/phosphomethylpyrimidine kinase
MEACSLKIIRSQMQALTSELPPAAVKTGMLLSAAIIRAVASWLCDRKCPIVVDPVMVATSGASLLETDAVKALRHALLPRATLITPNISEAEALLGVSIREPENMRKAARGLHEQFGCAALVKGGHLNDTAEAIDIFFDGSTELLLTAPRVPGVKTHGTGCTYSAAITAFLARGERLERAVRLAKEFVTRAIATSWKVHGHDVLNQSTVR